ncbi:Two-pore potassium channel 3 [Striga hermonthica]|uniref:Two-pore potassium channel 3 n=1 Tax=Striga hermonthica TaxID=68872 RepID=A0A9N7NLR7_STRHE|nr:Two-pore potassium channel 3 [Striga hermonthica]
MLRQELCQLKQQCLFFRQCLDFLDKSFLHGLEDWESDLGTRNIRLRWVSKATRIRIDIPPLSLLQINWMKMYQTSNLLYQGRGFLMRRSPLKIRVLWKRSYINVHYLNFPYLMGSSMAKRKNMKTFCKRIRAERLLDCKRRKMSQEEMKNIHHSENSEEPKRNVDLGDDRADAFVRASPRRVDVMRIGWHLMGGEDDKFGRNQCLPQDFDEMATCDYMRLLDLADDESSYLRAIAMPLSPLPPELNIHGAIKLKAIVNMKHQARRRLKRVAYAGENPTAAKALSSSPSESDMEKEPLLSYYRKPQITPSVPPPSLCPLPEDEEITIPPLPLTPSSREFKDMLIFGSPSSSSSSHLKDSSTNLLEALTLTRISPRCSAANINDGPINIDPESQTSWLVDPNYTFSKSNLHRSKTAPAMATINEIDHSSKTKPPQLGKTSIVRQGIVLLIIYLSLGVVIYSLNRDHFRASQTHPVVDALYFCIVTMCTIGYGDITPDSTLTKLFSITFVLVGFGFIDILLSGMVSYMLDLQETYLLRSIKSARDPGSYIFDVKKGRMRIRMKVALALGVVVLCIGIGAAVMHFIERLNWLDSFYLSVMSVTTVGYGDRAFTSLTGRIFASIWLLVSTLAVARAFLYLAEARVDKRHRMMAKWVLGQDMTVAQFLAADIDNNGFVSKSEYVVYKLKEMGKVSEKDILQICQQFERLDAGNCGKITLADLMESHH